MGERRMTPIDLHRWITRRWERATMLERLGIVDVDPALLDDDPDTIPDWVDYRGRRREDEHARGRSHGMRPWSQITGITLHQTATSALHASHPGVLSIPAHALIDPDGVVVLLQPLQAYMFHGHSLNRDTLGLEIVCRAAGVEGDMRTLWMSRRERAKYRPEQLVCEPTDRQIVAALAWCQWAEATVRHRGGVLTDIWAHRQGHTSRVSDPGSRIWQEVALPAAEILGLDAHPARVRGGKRIPDRWSGQGLGIRYNWRVR